MNREPIAIIGAFATALLAVLPDLTVTLIELGVSANWVRLGAILLGVVGTVFARSKVYSPATYERDLGEATKP